MRRIGVLIVFAVLASGCDDDAGGGAEPAPDALLIYVDARVADAEAPPDDHTQGKAAARLR